MNNSRYKDWIKPGIFSALQKISIPFFGVISTAFLAHEALSKVDMGVWVNFLALTAFVEMFRSGIVRTSLIKYINFAEKKEHSRIMSAAFLLNISITLVVFILLYSGAPKIELFLKSPGLAQMIHIYLFTLFFLIFFSHFEWLMYAHSSFKSLFYTYLVRQGFLLIGILLYYFIFQKLTLEALAIIYTISLFLGTCAAFITIRSIFSFRFELRKSWISQLWNFGKFVFGTNVCSLIFRNADQFILSNISENPALVASQNISMRIINIADIPSQVVGDILFPKSSNPQLKNNIKQVKYYYEKAVATALAVMYPFLLIIVIFPKLIILILAGPQYYDAIPYLRLICLVAIFLSFIKQWGVIIDSTGRPQVNFLIMIILASLQVTFCYLFIPHFHLMGAAIALLATHLVGFIITQSILYRYFRINFLNCFKYSIAFYPEILRILSAQFITKKKIE